MAKNISLLGADYPDVPAVQLPQTGGGTATFYDINVVDDLNSQSSTDALSANQGRVLSERIATATGGLRMLKVSTTVTIPDGRSGATSVTIDLSSFIPSGFTIFAISHVKIGDYILPYINPGTSQMTWVELLRPSYKTLVIKNTASAWNNYAIDFVLFVGI